MFTEVPDITMKIRVNIQNYVIEKFSSSLEDSSKRYDLLQDVDTIKSVFDKDDRMLYYLFHQDRIGKIGFNAEYLMPKQEHLVCHMFDLENRVHSLSVSPFSIS